MIFQMKMRRRVSLRCALLFVVFMWMLVMFFEYRSQTFTKYIPRVVLRNDEVRPIKNVPRKTLKLNSSSKSLNLPILSKTRDKEGKINWDGVMFNFSNKEELKKLIQTANEQQTIRNQFIPDLSEFGVVILVQVHKRREDLEFLIESLSNVKGIEKTLVVFSHDVVLPDIHKLIQNIQFCPVMQIFFPYSIQLYDGLFPADSKSDCPREIPMKKAKEMKCNNADHPDKFKHYREAKYTQMKHHWLWKIHFVFNDIEMLQDFKGMVLRIDNDYYLAPDILHIITLMRKHSIEHDENMFILGNHEIFSGESYSDVSVISNNWFTGVGRGMAFTKDLWQEIVACIDVFCTFDDYNWDWSLHKLITDCLKSLKVMKPIASRIFHIGRCHGFHKNERCTLKETVTKVKDYLQKNKEFMFPPKLTFDKRIDNAVNNVGGYGGWADPRDHRLCKAIVTSSSETEHVIQSINQGIQQKIKSSNS